jgi:hypothetical protein
VLGNGTDVPGGAGFLDAVTKTTRANGDHDMTEAAAAPAATTGVSELLGGVMSAAEARATIETLKSDRDFGKLLLTKVGYGETASPEVLAAKTRWDSLHKLAHPAPPEYSPEQIKDLPLHHDIRRQAEMHAVHGTQMAALGFSDIQIFQILGRRPCPAAEHELHEQRYQTLKRDATFMDRWSKGDRAAVREMKLAISGKSLPIAKSLAEIERWDREHPFPGVS